MTVISAAITKEFIVVATDSMITDSDNKNLKTYQLKYLCFPKLRCILSYWGQASIVVDGNKEWDANIDIPLFYDEEQKQSPFKDLEDFGIRLSVNLNREFKRHYWKVNKMLGIHLIGFEEFNKKMIPEVYLIIADNSNGWNFGCSRRTYGDMKNWAENDKTLQEQREEYYSVLENKGYSIYNNGDNEMFINFFNSIHGFLMKTSEGKHLKGGTSKDFFIDLVTFPIKQIAVFQHKYYFPEIQKVGGDINVVLMRKDGTVDVEKKL